MPEFLKAIEIQPICADEIYCRIAGYSRTSQLWQNAVLYYRKIKSTNDRVFIADFAKWLVELATQEAAAQKSPFWEINALYNEALPLLRRALVNDMDRNDNPELKEYLARALDGINEHEEATAIRNKIERGRKRKEEDKKLQEQTKRPSPLPEEFQTKFDKLYHEEQSILNTRYGLAGGSLISVTTTALEKHYSEDFVRHVEEIALQKLGVDADYMKALQAEYRQQRYEEDKARHRKGMVILGPDEERTIKFPPRSNH